MPLTRTQIRSSERSLRPRSQTAQDEPTLAMPFRTKKNQKKDAGQMTKAPNDAATTEDAPPTPSIPETPEKQLYVFEGVSYQTYQEMVNAKRKRNLEVLQNLGFGDTGGALRLESSKKPTSRGIKKQKTAAEPLPRRKSSRLASESTTLVAMDGNGRAAVVAGEGEEDKKDDELKIVFPKGRLNDGSEISIKDAIENMDSKWVKEGAVEQAKAFVRKNVANSCSDTAKDKEGDILEKVNNLSIDREEWVAKVVPDRIYSVAAHPSESKLIACAGDKLGYIGLWDVDSNDDKQGISLFRVHSRPVCCLQWATNDCMISASYDGTVRRLNVERGTFEQIFATYGESDNSHSGELGFGLDEGYRFWHQHVSIDPRSSGSNPCLFLATSVGKAMHIDLRVASSQKLTFNEVLSEKKINTLSLHPNGYTLSSAGNDGCIKLWDIRKFKGSKQKPGLPKAIATQHVGLSVSSAFFSPSGNALLSTSFANRLDIVTEAHKEKGTMEPTIKIPHDNQTGRWLSTFMACWHPNRDIFVSGSMKRPRRVEIYDAEGRLLKEVSGESLTAVASRCCFHPSTQNLVVIGGNSSGRVVAIR